MTTRNLDWFVTNGHTLDSDPLAGKYYFIGYDDGEVAAADKTKAVSTDALLSLVSWAPARQGWTYASSSTVYAAGNVTAIYSKGQRVRLVQFGATKYYYITAVSAYDSLNNRTTLTLNGGTDYTVANATIGAVYYSNISAPGFPDWFNYSPTLTGFSSNPTDTVYRFLLTPTTCRVQWRQGTAGTSNSNQFLISTPVTAKTLTNMNWYGYALGTDNGSSLSTPALAVVRSAATYIQLYKDSLASGWTTSGGKSSAGFIEYEW